MHRLRELNIVPATFIFGVHYKTQYFTIKSRILNGQLSSYREKYETYVGCLRRSFGTLR